MKKEQIYLPGLNGIRMIAALSVVISHSLLQMENFGYDKSSGFAFAGHGVTMFFTLSGFLITYLMLKEKSKFGDVSIKDFYVRRILRIWPLYFFYLLIIVLGIATSLLPGKLDNSMVYYFFLAPNIPFVLNNINEYLYHYWSLGVEEQFYLIWPWLFKKIDPLKAVSVFLAVFWLVKLLLRITMPVSFPYSLIAVTRFDCMAIGALFAILLSRNNLMFLRLAYNIFSQAAALLILVLAACDKLLTPDFIQADLVSVASAILIINVSFNPKSLVKLENKICNFLGKISFGIYVYHPLCIYLLTLIFKNRFDHKNFYYLQVVLIVITVLLFTISIAWLSYNYLEKWFLNQKHRFSKVESRS